MINRPGTMTNLYYTYRPGQENIVESLRRTKSIGFDVFDLCMCPMQRNEFELCEDDNWERFTDNIGNEAAKLGITFVQCHPVYPKPACRRKSAYEEGCEKNEFFMKMLDRSLEVAARLGIPWAVMHPLEDYSEGESNSPFNAQYNLDIYGPYLEKVASRGVGFAFENICDLDGKRRFGVTPEELFMILEKFGDSKVGICWDTGHGNRSYKDQIPALTRASGRLVCTHIDDNIGQTDLHQLPYMGTVKWERVMDILKESGYAGGFIYEVSLCKRLPEPLLDHAVKYAYEVSKYLLSL